MTLAESGIIAYLSIGSNIDAEHNLRRAVELLRESCVVLALSSVYQSPAYGWENQPDFLDIVAKISTDQPPDAFKRGVLDLIEQACGRDRTSQQNKYGPLPLDMDILLWGDTAFTFGTKPWKIPNSGITKYAAVAIPLAELAPDMLHPVEKMTIRELAARFPDAEKAAVRQRSDLEIR